MHGENFCNNTSWAKGLLKYGLKTGEYADLRETDIQENDRTMMFLVGMYYDGFKEQYDTSTLTTKEIIYIISKMIVTNKDILQKAMANVENVFIQTETPP